MMMGHWTRQNAISAQPQSKRTAVPRKINSVRLTSNTPPPFLALELVAVPRQVSRTARELKSAPAIMAAMPWQLMVQQRTTRPGRFLWLDSPAIKWPGSHN